MIRWLIGQDPSDEETNRDPEIWNSNWARLTVAAAVLIAAVTGLIASVAVFPIYSGDASIYLIFAKSMWNQGFFWYGPSGPKGGATSPLWAMLLSFFYLFSDKPMEGMKVLSYLIFAGVGAGVAFVASRMFRSNLTGAVCLVMWLLNYHGYKFASMLFETCLAALLITYLTYVTELLALAVTTGTPRKRVGVLWGILTGCLPLVRPEASLLAVLYTVRMIVACFRSEHSSRALGRLTAYLSIAAAVALPYYVYMYSEVGLMAFSSILGRKCLAAAAVDGQPWVVVIRSTINALLYHDRVSLVLLALSPLTLYTYWSKFSNSQMRSFIRLLVVAVVVYALPFLTTDTVTYHHTVRYLFPVYGLLTILAGVGLTAFLRPLGDVLFSRKRSRTLTFILVVVVSLIFSRSMLNRLPASGDTGRESQDRGDGLFKLLMGYEEATFLNSVMRPDEKLLIYEIQTQYFLSGEAVSLDGIVGGEVLPYLYEEESFEDFISAHDYIAVSGAFEYRNDLRRTILGEIFEGHRNISGEEDSPGVGQEILIGNLLLTKIWNRPNPKEVEWFQGATLAIYRISLRPE